MTRMLSEEIVKEYQMMLEANHPALYNAKCIADGLNLILKWTGDFIIE